MRQAAVKRALLRPRADRRRGDSDETPYPRLAPVAPSTAAMRAEYTLVGRRMVRLPSADTVVKRCSSPAKLVVLASTKSTSTPHAAARSRACVMAEGGGSSMRVIRSTPVTEYWSQRTPPVFDNLTTRGLFDASTSVFWSVDTFATNTAQRMLEADELADDEFRNGQFLGAGLVAPWHRYLDQNKWDRCVDAVRRLGATTIAGCLCSTRGGSSTSPIWMAGLPTRERSPSPSPPPSPPGALATKSLSCNRRPSLSRRSPPLAHEEAMPLAQKEYQRLMALVEAFAPENFTRPTDCTGWDVTALLSHLLGMLERNADPAEAARQSAATGQRAAATGETWIDALTALQVAGQAHLTPAQLAEAMRGAVPQSLAARRGASSPSGRGATGNPSGWSWTASRAATTPTVWPAVGTRRSAVLPPAIRAAEPVRASSPS